MSTPNKELVSLREYFLAGKSTDAEDVAEFLGHDDTSKVEGLVADLKKSYPDDFGGTEDETDHKFFLKNDQGILEELELTKEKNNTIYFVKKEPKDLVKIILKGKSMTVDLFQLRKPNAKDVEDVSPSEVIAIAELARA